MPLEADITPDALSDILEEINAKFAYKMLFLQIGLSQEAEGSRNRSVDIAELTSLYMKAVESLQGRFEKGFMFFHNKIQNLMKKRSVVEELFKSVNSSLATSEKTMMAISKAEIEERKEEYDLRMTIQNDKFDHKKVKEIIKMTEMKINMIESKIKTGILTQEENLAQRIKMRKLKSESSVNHQDKLKGRRMKTQNMEEYFAPQTPPEEQRKPRKRSSEKERKRKLLVFNSFSKEIKT